MFISKIRNRIKDYRSLISITYQAYYPYFTFSRANIWQWVYSAVLLLSNIAQAIIMGTINTGISNLFTTLGTPVLTYPLIANAVFDFIKPTIFFIGAILTTAMLKGRLINKLNYFTETEFGKKWLSSNISYGKSFTLKHNQLKSIKDCDSNETHNFSDFFSHDLPQNNSQFVNLIDDFTNKLSNFVVGIYYLWPYLSTYTITLGPMTLIFPSLLITGALTYSILYSFGISAIGRGLFNTSNDNKKHTTEFNKYTHHIESHAEQTALLKSNAREQANFKSILGKSITNQLAINNMQSYLSSFSVLGFVLNMTLSVILCIPEIIAQKIKESDLWTVSNNFTQSIGLLIWPAERYAELTELKVASNKMLELKRLFSLWDNTLLEKNLKLKVNTNAKSFSLENLTINGTNNCDLLFRPKPPKPDEIKNLPIKAKQAYLFVQNDIYYVDKNSGKATKLKIQQAKCKILIKELGFQIKDSDNYIESLSEQKLNLISQYTKHIHKNTILHQVNLAFQKGKRYIVTGENGIGKSTLFRTLAGIWPYAKGKINFPCEDKDICFLTQDGYIPLSTTLFDAVMYPKQCTSKNDKSKILKLLKELNFDEDNKHLGEAAKTKDWNFLSNGQKQKIALVRAIMSQPKVLLMDEPFSSLSKQSVALAKKVLVNNLPKETTIVCIDHQSKLKTSVGEIPFYSDHIQFENQSLRLTKLQPTAAIIPLFQARNSGKRATTSIQPASTRLRSSLKWK